MCLHLYGNDRPRIDRKVIEYCDKLMSLLISVDSVNYDLSLQVAERTAWRQNHIYAQIRQGYESVWLKS